jgi:hypothetical protein
MRPGYREVTLDLDGTIALVARRRNGCSPRSLRPANGIRVLLVTGQILAELEAEFPGLSARFDAVYAENDLIERRYGLDASAEAV